MTVLLMRLHFELNKNRELGKNCEFILIELKETKRFKRGAIYN